MSLLETSDTQTTSDALFGEDKKYKTAADVARALQEKDSFIERLKREAEEARSAVRAVPTDRSQEILDQLEALKASRTTPSVSDTLEQPRVTEKGLSESDIERVMAQREQKLKSAANIATVKETLKGKFGDGYGKALETIATENGLSIAELEGIASRSPTAALKLFGEVKQEKGFVPPTSSVSPSFTPQATNHKTDSFYKNLLATNRNEYFSQKTQNQMYKDAMALKEAFYD